MQKILLDRIYLFDLQFLLYSLKWLSFYVHTVVFLCSTKNLDSSLCKTCHINEITLLCKKHRIQSKSVTLCLCFIFFSDWIFVFQFTGKMCNVKKENTYIYNFVKPTPSWQNIQFYFQSCCRHNIVHNFWWSKNPFCIHVVKYKLLTIYLGKYIQFLPFASDSRGVTRHGSAHLYFQYVLY